MTDLNRQIRDFVKKGKFEEALKICDSLIEYSPKTAGFWLDKAGVLFNWKKYDQALATVEQAIKRGAKWNPKAWLLKASSLLILGQLDDAIKAAEQTIKRARKKAHFGRYLWRGWGVKAKALEEKGHLQAAHAAALQSWELNPDPVGNRLMKALIDRISPQAQFEKFNKLFRQKNFEEALVLAEWCIEVYPKNAKFWKKQVQLVKEELKDAPPKHATPVGTSTQIDEPSSVTPRAAIPSMEDLLEDPESVMEIREFAKGVLKILQKSKNASPSLQPSSSEPPPPQSQPSVSDPPPPDSDISDEVEGFPLDSARIVAAEQLVGTIVPIGDTSPQKPDSVKALHGKVIKAGHLIRDNELQAAQELMEEVIHVDAGFLPAWQMLVSISLKQKNFTKAKDAAIESLRLDPNKATGWVLLSNAHFKLELFQEALNCAHKAISVSPTYSGWLAMGASYYMLDEFDNAEKALRNAIDLEPQSKTAWRLLVGTYDKLKNEKQAQYARQKLQELS
jgi:tetratricopeptide (TPR) repeat protein